MLCGCRLGLTHMHAIRARESTNQSVLSVCGKKRVCVCAAPFEVRCIHVVGLHAGAPAEGLEMERCFGHRNAIDAARPIQLRQSWCQKCFGTTPHDVPRKVTYLKRMPAWVASASPLAVRGTSVHPMYRLSRFQVLSPCRSSTRRYAHGSAHSPA